MNKYELRTNKKKEAIITSAMSLFRENGFVSTSIKEIAEKAQVSQVSIYNYFGSKEALVIECTKELVRGTLEHAMTILDEELPYKEKVMKALSLCNSEINRTLSAYLSESALKDKNFLSLLSGGLAELQSQLYEAFIEAGKAEGAISKEIPTAVILKFVASFNQIEISSEQYHQEVEHLHHLFLYGLLGK